MKKYFAFFASAALMMAACAKEEVNTPVDSPVAGETELITVELNPGTKTSLNGKVTNWTAGDAVRVTANGTSLGNLEFNDKTGKFSGELNSAELEDAKEVTLNYPAGVTKVPTTQEAVADNFSTSNGNPTALLEGTTTMAVLRAGNGAELSNKTALLKFSVAQAGTVTFEVGSTKYTVTGCEVGNTYYACVAPATASFTARIDGYLSKKAANNVVFEANDVKNLGELPAPEPFSWGLVGKHQGWDMANLTPMYKVDNNVYAVLNISLQSNGFKFAKKDGDGSWKDQNNFGAWTATKDDYYEFGNSSNIDYGAWYGNNTSPIYSNNHSQKTNIGVTDFSKKYDIYVKVYNTWTDNETDGKGTGVGVKYTIVTAGTTVTYPN